MTAHQLWVIYHLALLGLLVFSLGMSAWREKNADTCAKGNDIVDAARRAANLKEGDLARELEMDEGQWTRLRQNGGNFNALLVLSLRHPVFGAALYARWGELLQQADESPVDRFERLIAELYALPRKGLKCEGVKSSISSVA